MTLTIGSVCSGTGGLHLAVEKYFGGKVKWVAENNRAASKLLSIRFPEAENIGDLRTVDWSEVPPVDVICGGFPCQPYSVAGLRKSSADKRAIFSHIAEGISILEPGILVFENVRGFISRRDAAPAILGQITEFGFDTNWAIIRASTVGCCHQRARFFSLSAHPSRQRHGRQQDNRMVGELGAPTEGFGWPISSAWQESYDRIEEDGFITDSDGSGRSEQRWAFSMEEELRSLKRGSSENKWGKYTKAIERWELIHGPAPEPLDDLGMNPEWSEWMMGLPRGWITDIQGISRTASIKLAGNAVVPHQALFALQVLNKKYD